MKRSDWLLEEAGKPNVMEPARAMLLIASEIAALREVLEERLMPTRGTRLTPDEHRKALETT